MERHQVPIKTIFELNVILEEVFVSIVHHCKEGKANKMVHFRLLLDPGLVTVFITDHNDAFDPTVIPAIDLNAPLEEISFRGLGFHLVRHLANEISYQRVEGQNV